MQKIEIYTRPGCIYCASTKHYLEQHGLSYTEYDVMRDQSKLIEMQERSNGRSFPQIFIDDQAIGGFEDLLKRKLLKESE